MNTTKTIERISGLRLCGFTVHYNWVRQIRTATNEPDSEAVILLSYLVHKHTLVRNRDGDLVGQFKGQAYENSLSGLRKLFPFSTETLASILWRLADYGLCEFVPTPSVNRTDDPFAFIPNADLISKLTTSSGDTNPLVVRPSLKPSEANLHPKAAIAAAAASAASSEIGRRARALIWHWTECLKELGHLPVIAQEDRTALTRLLIENPELKTRDVLMTGLRTVVVAKTNPVNNGKYDGYFACRRARSLANLCNHFSQIQQELEAYDGDPESLWNVIDKVRKRYQAERQRN